MRIPLTCEIYFEGGSEGQVSVLARGWRFVFPGNVTIVEMLQALNGQALGEYTPWDRPF